MKIRHRIKVLLSGITVKIRKGPLKGKKWIISTSMREIKGEYVPRDANTIMKLVAKGDTVYDIGGHTGYFSVLSSDIVGKEGKVFAFEPSPMNLKFINKHIRINRCDNIKVFSTCISNTVGEDYFDDNLGSGTGQLSKEGKLKVKVNTLDNLLKTGEISPPNFIKCNAEGAEYLILLGSKDIIEKYKPKFLITFHSDELKNNCIKILEQNRYEIHGTADDAIYAV